MIYKAFFVLRNL